MSGTDFTGKVAIITGASSGIGRSYARALGASGAKLVLVARDAAPLDAVAGEFENAIAVAADVSQPASADRIVATAIQEYGTVDIVLSNAGVYLAGEFAQVDPVALQRIVSVNVFGALAVVRAALPVLLANRDGDVIVTSSVSGHQAIHWEPVYSATKHAVQAFVHGVRRQLVGTGVRIGEIAPGVVLNELWGFDELAETAPQLAAATGIRSEDVADAVLYMLSRPRHVNIRDLVILPTSQDI
ncbi:MAG: SDR family oxidoreductase [Microbacteriaceae bacterium]